jgi:hypothetical protein
VKREHESIEVRPQKMMRGKVEPFVILIVVWVVPTMVHATKQTTKVPQMTFPKERQFKEQRYKVPQMTAP